MSKRKYHSPEFQARRDVFEYIELFYNPKRKRSFWLCKYCIQHSTCVFH